MLRKIVEIDEAKCDGCGECISSCAEGAIALVGGKAKLVSDVYCDGLGACLGECPQGAIAVVEREARRLRRAGGGAPPRHPRPAAAHGRAAHPTARRARPGAGRAGPGPTRPPRAAAPARRCASCRAAASRWWRPIPARPRRPRPALGGSTLGHWPVQLQLVPPHAPFLRGAHLLVAADCVPFAYAGFHADLLAGKALVVGCPKLDDNQAYAAKLAEICARAGLQSITVARMEVPCCGGIAWAAREGVARSGAAIPVKDVVIGVDGAIRQG